MERGAKFLANTSETQNQVAVMGIYLMTKFRQCMSRLRDIFIVFRHADRINLRFIITFFHPLTEHWKNHTFQVFNPVSSVTVKHKLLLFFAVPGLICQTFVRKRAWQLPR
ncbi:hypothetical protein SPFM8_00062 [Salmonella phage SPFM8]|nr:hypothetical protein SPFM8_00062 [Salmonella phage SPFM8]